MTEIGWPHFSSNIISLLAVKVRTDLNSTSRRHAAYVFSALNFSHKIVWAEQQTKCFAKCLVQTDTITLSLTCSCKLLITAVIFLSFNKIYILCLNIENN